MTEYVVWAYSPQLNRREPELDLARERYTDHQQAGQRAAEWALQLRTRQYLGATDWGAWVGIDARPA